MKQVAFFNRCNRRIYLDFLVLRDKHKLFECKSPGRFSIKCLRTKTTAAMKKMVNTDVSVQAVFVKIYGLPKVHKIGLPLRPIAKNAGSQTYHSSKFLSSSLTQDFGGEL